MEFDPAGYEADVAATKKRLGQKLKDYREAEGLSADELAGLIRRHRSTVHNTEAGKSISIDTLAELSIRCGVHIDDFLAGFQSKDIPADLQEDFQMLRVILTSGFKTQVQAARTALAEIYEAVLSLKQARAKGSEGALAAKGKKRAKSDRPPPHTPRTGRKGAGAA